MFHATFSDIPGDFLNAHAQGFLQGEFVDLYPRIFPEQNTLEIIQEYQAKWSNNEQRKVLAEVLKEQYRSIPLSEIQKEHLQYISNIDGFCVSTGQQIHPFLGPAFVWAKIQSTLNTARYLSHLSGKKVVPLFWMASEDHDFEEIKQVSFLGKNYEWKAQAGGPVGRLDTEGIADLLGKIQTDFQKDAQAIHFLSSLEGIYKKGRTLAESTRILIQLYFGDQGLLVIDPDDVRLKQSVVDVWLRELDSHSVDTLARQAEKMKKIGIKIPITPRQTGLFYMRDHFRLRILANSDNEFQTVDNEFRWNKDELKKEIQNHPDRFSPNALLRPVYQQRILPNLAYIGGPAECLYWLQVPTYIDWHEAIVPLLQLRLMMQLLPSGVMSKIQAFPWKIEHWFAEEELLVKDFLESEQGDLALTKNIQTLKEKMDRVRESLYEIKHPDLKSIKKLHEEHLRQLLKIQKEFLEHGMETHYAPKIKQIRQLKSRYFNKEKLTERAQFWIEWQFVLQGNPVIENINGPFLWLQAKD